MNLGDMGRKTIKGNDRDYYLHILQETRTKSLAEFSKRDDAWLMAVDKDWPWGPTNNLCKWFHVCEHEAHHTGQIAFLRKRCRAQNQTLRSLELSQSCSLSDWPSACKTRLRVLVNTVDAQNVYLCRSISVRLVESASDAELLYRRLDRACRT